VVLPRAAQGPGPTAVEDGIPVGYARTEAGASAAAAGYLEALATLATRPSTERIAALQRMAAPDSTDGIVADVEEALATVDEVMDTEPSSRILVRSVPVGYRVLEYSPERALVVVWGTTVFVLEGVSAPEEAWGTSEVELVWHEGDWRVERWEHHAGPTPANRMEAPSPEADVVTVLEELDPFGHVPAP